MAVNRVSIANSLSHSKDTILTPDEIYGALEGVVYVTDRDGNLLAKGEPSWSSFARDNSAPELAENPDLNCYSACDDKETADAYRQIYEALWAGQINSHYIAFRCDSPSFRREFRLSLSRVGGKEGTAAILHQSLAISETIRPPLDIFNPEVRRLALQDGPLVKICSYCLKIFSEVDADWIETEEYYRRGGKSDVRLSHGMCLSCRETVLAPLKAR